MTWYDNATLMTFRPNRWPGSTEEKISHAEARARRADLERTFALDEQQAEVSEPHPCATKRWAIS